MSRPAERLAEHLVVRGLVQGVGFRWWIAREARFLGLEGWVRNRRDGSVEVLAIGAAAAIEALARSARRGPSAAQVTGLDRDPAQDDGSRGFESRPTV